MRSLVLLALPCLLSAQITGLAVNTTTTQAVIQYAAPSTSACSLKIADLERGIAIASGSQSTGTVTITAAAPHGLLSGATVYLQNSGVSAWDGWQGSITVTSTTAFTFSNATGGTSSGGNVGVLIDDVNTTLFPGSDQDTRAGSITNGVYRQFVAGLRLSPVASDANRYSRALQAFARHHVTITCGASTADQDFRTQNIPRGDTHNDAALVDPANPGQYGFPTIQWNNHAQALIDPLTGLRSTRVTFPVGTASASQNFVTVPNPPAAWSNPNGPLTSGGGAATYTGGAGSPGVAGALFIRADSLDLPGGADFYSSTGSSLDWFQFKLGAASISNGSCAGDDCKISVCLTVDGITCASTTKDQTLTGSSATYTIGSQTIMDLWQTAGTPPTIDRVDVSKATGLVTYVASTKVVTWQNSSTFQRGVSGDMFSLKWGAGSRLSIAGTEYCVVSVQSERQLTLAPSSTGCNAPPGSDITSNTAYSAPNFGVLVWKKTTTADTISIGNATYLYGSTAMPNWPSDSQNNCGPQVADSNGLPGYNCFLDRELYFFPADGGAARDLGHVGTTYFGPLFQFLDDQVCGTGAGAASSGFYQFDPADGNTWYCNNTFFYNAGATGKGAIAKATYNGDHQRTSTPGVRLPDCNHNSNTPPCVQFTLMQPNINDSVQVGAPLFNPDYAASGCVNNGSGMAGVSPDGDLEAFIECGGGQDWPGWLFVYTLGDRTPTGSGPNSFRQIAAGATYRKAPASYCTIHDAAPPFNGWTVTISNDTQIDGNPGLWTTTLTSTHLNVSVGVPGGLNACPANPLNYSGSDCTAITVNGQPISAVDGSVLQNLQNGDTMLIDSERVRVLDVSGFPNLLVQRGYFSTAASHGGTTLQMSCAAINGNGIRYSLWNYKADPMGTNSTGTTIITDPNYYNGHNNVNGGVPQQPVYVSAADSFGFSTCTAASGTDCYQTRSGYAITAVPNTPYAIANSSAFAGIAGIGQANWVDSHPGPCFLGYCTDARPFDGGAITGAGSLSFMVGPSSSPFTSVSGQLWKASGTGILNRKFLSTLAYVGRFPLLDVSGPSCSISDTSADSYKYGVVTVAGECFAGSSVGDVYVNAPFVGYGYCYYPGVAVPNDDVNGICIGDLGANTGAYSQWSYNNQTLTGSPIRRLGPLMTRWNQQYVFWSATSTPNGAALISRATWLDQVRHEDLLTVLPPFPAWDGVNRKPFIPVTVTVPQLSGGSTAAIEFGYDTSFDCTSRGEACEAVLSTVNQTTPFYFASETYTKLSCASGCSIAIPALSQKILYYRLKYYSSGGSLISTGSTQAAVTP